MFYKCYGKYIIVIEREYIKKLLASNNFRFTNCFLNIISIYTEKKYLP